MTPLTPSLHNRLSFDRFYGDSYDWRRARSNDSVDKNGRPGLYLVRTVTTYNDYFFSIRSFYTMGQVSSVLFHKSPVKIPPCFAYTFEDSHV